MNVDSYTLTANKVHTFNWPARFFMLISSGGPVTVRFRKNGSRTREVATLVEAGYVSEPGDWGDPEDRFDAFELQSTSNQTVRVGVSDRRGDYRRALALVQVEQPDTLATIADVTVSNVAKEIAPANLNRRKIILQNVSANDVRIGDLANVATGRGIRLPGGASITLDTTAQIAGIREDAADATIAVIEETKS